MKRHTQDMSQSVPLKLISNRWRTGIGRGCGIFSSISPLRRGTWACKSLGRRSRYSGTAEGLIFDSRIMSFIEVDVVEGPAALFMEAIISFSSSTGLLVSECADGAVAACLGLELPLEWTAGRVSRSTVNGVTGIRMVDRAWISISFSILFIRFSSASCKGQKEDG